VPKKRRTSIGYRRPTPEQILQFISYDTQTGVFTRRNGTRAGYFSPRTLNLIVAIGGKVRRRFEAGRLAWFLVYGYVPRAVRHINGNRGDCRIRNLARITVRVLPTRL